MNINLNSIVRVKLTDFGTSLLKRQFGKEPTTLVGKYWSAPLWQVMYVLGGYTFQGCPADDQQTIFASSVFASLDMKIVDLA